MNIRILTPAALLVATGCYLSYIPVKFSGFIVRLDLPSDIARGMLGSRFRARCTGSGFVGTLLGWCLVPLLPQAPMAYGCLIVLGTAGACWASGVAERELGRPDDPRIIIDEVLGYWIAVAFLPHPWQALLAGFILFRIFDTVKLPLYRWMEDLPGGYGIVFDDVGAGLVTNILLRASAPWSPWW